MTTIRIVHLSTDRFTIQVDTDDDATGEFAGPTTVGDLRNLGEDDLIGEVVNPVVLVAHGYANGVIDDDGARLSNDVPLDPDLFEPYAESMDHTPETGTDDGYDVLPEAVLDRMETEDRLMAPEFHWWHMRDHEDVVTLLREAGLRIVVE